MAAPVKISLTKRPVASSLVRVDPSQQAPFNIRGRGALKAKTFECSFCEETFSSGSVRSPDKKANLYQCYVCALEFKSESILNLHLEKVHLIGGAQNLVEKETKPQNVETPGEVNGEIFD